MNILFTVCGRAGSKGLKNKNLKEFLEFPLSYYTLSAIDMYKKKYNNVHNIDICINTDSHELLNLIDRTKLDIIKIFRKEELGRDDTPKVSVIRNSLEECEKLKNKQYEVIVDLDITSPLRTVFDIENVINKKNDKKQVDVVFSVVHSRRNPYFNMVKSDNGEISKVISSNYVARQQAPVVYDMNASIYAYSRKFLSDYSNTSIFDGRVDIVEMMDTAVLDIDCENDFELMEIVAKYLLEKLPGFSQVRDNIVNIRR